MRVRTGFFFKTVKVMTVSKKISKEKNLADLEFCTQQKISFNNKDKVKTFTT